MEKRPENYHLVDLLLNANRTSDDFPETTPYWIKTKKKELDWTETDGLLTKNDTLYMFSNQSGQHLRIWLFDKIYSRFLIVYSRRNKIKKLFCIQYY